MPSNCLYMVLRPLLPVTIQVWLYAVFNKSNAAHTRSHNYSLTHAILSIYRSANLVWTRECLCTTHMLAILCKCRGVEPLTWYVYPPFTQQVNVPDAFTGTAIQSWRSHLFASPSRIQFPTI